MAFDWGTDINQATEDAIGRLPEYNSGNFNPGTNPFGLAGGGHITNFPGALTDTAQVADGFALFADLMESYANAAAASAIDAAAGVANLSGTSTSSVALSTGAKSFVTQSGKSWPAGSILLLSSDANPTTHWMVLRVTSYVGTALGGDAIVFSGSGSRADWTIRAAGYPGRAGGLAYLWSTSTTAADPTAGKLRMNAAPSSATAFYISETDFDGNPLGPLLATWDDSISAIKGRLFIQGITQPANFAIVDITSTMTDNGTWDSFAITPVATGGTLAEGMQVSIIFVPTGNPGDTGPAGASYAATSATSLTIGTGAKVFTTQAGLAYQIGTRARAADSGNPATNWLEGVVTAYSGTSLTILSDTTSGSGTIANWTISVAGNPGTTGATGATGDDAGFEFQFNTAVAGDPGAGKFLFNNASFLSATQWAISETDNNGLNIASLLAAIDNGTGTNKILVFIIKQGGAAYFSFYVTSTLTDQGAYDTFTISPISTAGSIANNDTFHVITIPLERGDTGATGAAGPTTAPVWTFDAGTSAVDPGTNEFALNNASIASVTALYINETGPGASDLSAYIASWDDSTNSTHRGTLYIIQTTDPSKYAILTTGTVTDNGAFDTVALTYVAGPGGFTAGQACAFSFTRSGNAGAGAGDVVGPASATNNGIALFDGTTGKLLKNSAAVGNLAYLNTVGSAQIDANAVSLDKLATQAAGSVLANVTGGTATPTAVDIDTTFKTALALVKADVGLSSVDNTSDANKPVSTAQAAVNAVKKFVSVRAATTANITIATALNNADVLDGVTLATGDLVLVKNQSSAAENGIYVVGPSPARHGEYDTYNEHAGALVSVQEGTTNADTLWQCTSDVGGTINSTALAFTQLDVTAYTAHATLTLTGQQFALNLANANVWTASQTFINASGIRMQDTDASHTLGLVVGSNLTANRTLTLTLGDADRTIQLGGNIITAAAFTISGASALTLTVTGSTNVTLPTAGTLATTDASSLTSGTLPDARLSSAATPYGRESIWIPATAMTPNTTNGPASGSVQTTTNLVMLPTLDFDASTQEAAQFNWKMPDQWNEGTVTFQPVWKHAATVTSFGVAWDMAGVAVGDGELGDAAFGTVQTVTDTGGTTNAIYTGAESSAITIGGTPQAGDWVALRVRRAPANGADTMTIDAGLLGIVLHITTVAGHD